MQAAASASVLEGSAAKYRLDGFDVGSICSMQNRFDKKVTSFVFLRVILNQLISAIKVTTKYCLLSYKKSV